MLCAGLIAATVAARGITRPIDGLRRLAENDDFTHTGLVAASDLPETDMVAQALLRAATERGHVARALAESEQRFRTLFEQSPSGTILLDPETARVIDCNDIAAGFVGCTIEAFRGRCIIDFSPQTGAAKVWEICRSVASGQTWRYETRISGLSGPRDLLIAIAPARVSGRTLMLINQIDITDLRGAQADLRVNQERLELARQGADLGIWDWDIEHDTLTWSEHQWHLNGLQPRDVGPTPLEWAGIVRPADLHIAQDALRSALKNAGVPYRSEYSVIMPNGSLRRLLGRGQTIRDASGRAIRMVGINMDVTARYEAEMARDQLISALETERSRLSDIIEALPIGVGIIDSAGRVILGNAAVKRLIGVVIPSQVDAPQEVWSARHPDGSRIAPRDFPGARALRGETVLPGQEFLYRGEAGRETWIRVGAIPLRWEDGRVQEAVIMLLDIDAEKRLLDIQQQVNARLEQRVREEVAAREAAQQRAAHAERMHALGQIAGGIAQVPQGSVARGWQLAVAQGTERVGCVGTADPHDRDGGAGRARG